jgi:hypothetical protein
LVVDGHQVATELVASCDAGTRRTWLPDEPIRVPSGLLVLAAMALARA